MSRLEGCKFSIAVHRGLVNARQLQVRQEAALPRHCLLLLVNSPNQFKDIRRVAAAVSHVELYDACLGVFMAKSRA